MKRLLNYFDFDEKRPSISLQPLELVVHASLLAARRRASVVPTVRDCLGKRSSWISFGDRVVYGRSEGVSVFLVIHVHIAIVFPIGIDVSLLKLPREMPSVELFTPFHQLFGQFNMNVREIGFGFLENFRYSRDDRWQRSSSPLFGFHISAHCVAKRDAVCDRCFSSFGEHRIELTPKDVVLFFRLVCHVTPAETMRRRQKRRLIPVNDR